MRKVLSADQINKSKDRPIEWVPCPEWAPPGTPPEEAKDYGIFVRTLTGSERDEFEADSLDRRGKDPRVNLSNMRARLCALTMCQEDETLLYKTAEAVVLGTRSSLVLDRVFSVAQKLSGLRKEDVEELTKNSESNPS